MLEQAVQRFFSDWLAAFFNPQKRVFWGYLLSALAIGFLWLFIYKRVNLASAFKQIFSPVVWLSKSARADYLLMIFNGVIMTFLSPRLLAKATIASLLKFSLNSTCSFSPCEIIFWISLLVIFLFVSMAVVNE